MCLEATVICYYFKSALPNLYSFRQELELKEDKDCAPWTCGRGHYRQMVRQMLAWWCERSREDCGCLGCNVEVGRKGAEETGAYKIDRATCSMFR